MPNITITTCDKGSGILGGEKFRDELLTAGGAKTFKPGTILARDSSTGKMVAYVKGGVTNGNGVPKALLTYEVVAAGAGDTKIRAMVAGEFALERAVIDADGTSANIDGPVTDQLRAESIVLTRVKQLSVLDNGAT